MNGDRSPDELETDSEEELADRWAAYEVPKRSRKRVVITWAVALGAVVALVGAGYVVWTQWHDWTGCSRGEERVIDETSRLCYGNPEGWAVLTEAELEQRFKGPGLAFATSGLNSSASTDPFVEVTVDEYYYADDANADTSLVELAETHATSSTLMQAITDPKTESEALTIDGHEAATATAYGLVPSTYEEQEGDLQFWAKVTIVDLGDRISVMYSGATIAKWELTDEDGEVATIEAIHESITIK